MKHPALDLQVEWRRGLATDQMIEGVIQCAARCLAERDAVDVRLLQEGQSIILLGLQVDHVQAIFNHVDERHKQLAVDTALVEVGRRPVRRRHHNDAAFKEFFEQAAQDHRVGDIGYVQFVETQ